MRRSLHVMQKSTVHVCREISDGPLRRQSDFCFMVSDLIFGYYFVLKSEIKPNSTRKNKYQPFPLPKIWPPSLPFVELALLKITDIILTPHLQGASSEPFPELIVFCRLFVMPF